MVLFHPPGSWNRFLREKPAPSTDTGNALCQKCRGISLDQMRGPNCDRMQPHQPSYLALKQSAIDGCVLCRFIWFTLGQSVAPGGERGAHVLEHVSERYPGRAIALVGWGGGSPNSFLDRIYVVTVGEIPDVDADGQPVDSSGDPTMHPDHGFALSGALDILTYPDDPAAWHGGVTGRPLPTTDGSSDADFTFAHQCLQECLNDHGSCHTGANPNLPTRVLDLGPQDGSQVPCLLETKGLAGRYATLSHRWGGDVCLTTRSDNLEEHKKGIPTAHLPPTLKHAVQISRRLGIRYLWIDSLCILQDSKDDWEEESAKMRDTYKNSFLTIAARAVKNAKEGCFITRDQEISACRLEYRSPEPSAAAGSIYIRDPAFQMERLGEAPLDSRGWVLQKKLLPPRILYYGAQQIYWECRQASVRQDGKYYDVTGHFT